MKRFRNFLPLIYGLTPSDWLPFLRLPLPIPLNLMGISYFIYAFLSYVRFSGTQGLCKGRFTHSMPFQCWAHAVPLPCLAAKDLERVFPIWFTQCGRVWFTLAMPCPCHAPAMPFFSRPQRSTAVLCCDMAWAWHGTHGRAMLWHGMGMAWHTRPHCVNQMGKTF